MKSAAKPVKAPGSGPNSMPAMKMGTASMEKRVVSLGMGISRRARMTLSAVSSAQMAMERTLHPDFSGFLDIKKAS